MRNTSLISVSISARVMAGGSSSRAVDGSLWVLLGSLSAFIDSVTINIVLTIRDVSPTVSHMCHKHFLYEYCTLYRHIKISGEKSNTVVFPLIYCTLLLFIYCLWNEGWFILSSHVTSRILELSKNERKLFNAEKCTHCEKIEMRKVDFIHSLIF